MGAAISITVNGQAQTVPQGTSVEALVLSLGLPVASVAVERNLRLVPKQARAQTHLEAGDQLEIVTLVGGG